MEDFSIADDILTELVFKYRATPAAAQHPDYISLLDSHEGDAPMKSASDFTDDEAFVIDLKHELQKLLNNRSDSAKPVPIQVFMMTIMRARQLLLGTR